jgi:hypothetical protein
MQGGRVCINYLIHRGLVLRLQDPGIRYLVFAATRTYNTTFEMQNYSYAQQRVCVAEAQVHK